MGVGLGTQNIKMEQVLKLESEGVQQNVPLRPGGGLLTMKNLEPSVQWLAADCLELGCPVGPGKLECKLSLEVLTNVSSLSEVCIWGTASSVS
jgi:hypothetical protein